ncbi:MAG: hypothetical protein IJS47_02270 [Clostridia bacterium]|nr:hypothetical protein [Clostridia bacterium]
MKRGEKMNTETEYTYETYTDIQLLNEKGLIKPHAYQTMFGAIADKHLSKIGLNVDTTMKYNLAWALISLSVEIEKHINEPTKLFAKTWHSEKKGPFYRREYKFMNEKGETIFKGSSYSILLDIENRSIYRKKETPFSIGEPYPEFMLDNLSASFKEKHVYDKVSERQALNSYIDCLGHVNNCRYGEFAYDALSETEVENLQNLKRMDIYFLSELRKNDHFTVLKAYDGDKILVRGHNNDKNDISFDVVMTF